MASKLVQARYHFILAQTEKSKCQQDIVNTLRTAATISTQRSYADLIYKMKKVLPEFFGF
jgi:hypothetical protein